MDIETIEDGAVNQVVRSTLTIQKTTSIEGGDIALLEAKRAADREFDRYFIKFHRYIERIECNIIREFYENASAYRIQIYVEVPLEVVQELHKAAGVNVIIPQENIYYKPLATPVKILK